MSSQQTQQALTSQLENQLIPLIRKIVSFRLGGGRHRQEIEDVCGQVLVQLLPRLNENASGENALKDPAAYAAVLAYNASHEYLRQKNPQRHRVRNRIRYLLGNDSRFRLWQSSTGAWICALADTAAKPAVVRQELSADELLHALPPEISARPQSFPPQDVVTAVLKQHGAPLDFDVLVDVMARLWGVQDREQAIDVHPGSTVADRGPSPDESLQRKNALAALWSEVCELPVAQRAALLLNLRDEENGSPLQDLPALGIASIRKIAELVAIPAEEFARLWNDLPLDDLSIAARLKLTRQQVINLRKSARARLSRRLGWLLREIQD